MDVERMLENMASKIVERDAEIERLRTGIAQSVVGWGEDAPPEIHAVVYALRKVLDPPPEGSDQ
jgi:hypothetical protein